MHRGPLGDIERDLGDKAVPEPPDAAFRRDCERIGVEPEDLEPLWRLYRRAPGGRKSDPARLEMLLKDYGHWLLYVRSREGDADAARAFERFWSKHIAMHLARRFKPGEIEDISAAFFARVYRHMRTRFHWKCPFSAYLRAILANLARDESHRLGVKRRRELSLDEDGVADQLRSTRASPEEALISGQRRVELERVLFQLPPVERHILRVCLVEDGSGQELAAALGITRDALYQRLHRAKKRLKELLRREGVMSDG